MKLRSGSLKILKLQTNQSAYPGGFIYELYKTFKEELIPILFSYSKKTEEDETLPDSFYMATITHIPKPDQTKQKKSKRKLKANIFDEYKMQKSSIKH